jgi:membrane associated rhomboid family serine protease
VRRGNADLVSVAPLTVSLLGINIALYLYCVIASDDLTPNHDVLLFLGMSQRERLWENEWYRLVMPNFLHGGILHIFMNMYSLYFYGPAAEVHFGTSNFGTLYLLSGVGGFALSQMVVGFFAVGASASIMGILGAYLAVKALEYPVLKNAWKGSEVRSVAFWIALQFAIGLSGAIGNIDNLAHLGGLIFGILIGGFFELWRRQRRVGLHLIVAMVLLVAASVVAARWTVFSPYYHIHKAAIATEEDNDLAGAEKEFKEAMGWAKFWRKDIVVNGVIQTYRNKKWNLSKARDETYYIIERNIRWVNVRSF